MCRERAGGEGGEGGREGEAGWGREGIDPVSGRHHGAAGDAADHCWQPARREEPASDGGTLDDELRRRLGVG